MRLFGFRIKVHGLWPQGSLCCGLGVESVWAPSSSGVQCLRSCGHPQGRPLGLSVVAAVRGSAADSGWGSKRRAGQAVGSPAVLLTFDFLWYCTLAPEPLVLPARAAD